MKQVNLIKTLLLTTLISSTYAQAKYRESFISFEVKTKKVFSKKNEDKRVFPASLTKIMTAHIILRDIKNLNEKTTISKNAWGHKFRHGSRMFLEPKTEVSINDLLKGLLIQSGNDAAVALAEFHSGSRSRFVEEMNATAKRLGMKNSNFKNPNGRHHRKHYTTASDFRLLIIETIIKTPEITNYTTKKSFKYNDIIQYNRNKAIDYNNSIGLKTGFTPQSGYNLASCFYERNGFFCTIEFGAARPEIRFENTIDAKNKFYNDKKVLDIEPQKIQLQDSKNSYTIKINHGFVKLIERDENITTKVIRTSRAPNKEQNVEIEIKSENWEEKLPATLKTTPRKD